MSLGSLLTCCERRDFEPRGDGQAEETPNFPPASQVCGVGINFRADKSGALFVSSLIPGGPAARTGSVMVGDILFEVDGQNVHRSTLSHVSKHLLGPNGSVAKVMFLRGGYKVQVDIPRAPVPSLMSVQRVQTPRSPGDPSKSPTEPE
eukprot:Tamp_26979.p1 GENE.Tamp_26979~~Tamp_26979.p1  ORF type:complete len:148 (+),score=29.24 Tamp_26979:117-560(+)